MVLNSSDLQTVSDVLRELYAHTDAPTLPHCMTRLVRRLISADSSAYNHIDYQSRQIEVIHDHGPEADRLMPALNAHIGEHPVLNHWQAKGPAKAAKLSDFLTRRQLRDTAIYQEFFGPLRLNEQIGIFVEERGRVAITLSLQRNGSNFTERDRQLLVFVRPHFIQAYKNAADLTRFKARSEGMEGAIDTCDLGVVWLAGEKVEWMSSRAASWLQTYFPNAGGKGPAAMPAKLLDWIRHVRAARNGGVAAEWNAETRFAGPAGVLNVRLVEGLTRRSYLILAQETRELTPADLCSLGVTRREAEVLYWISQGKTNGEIALLISASRRTVEKHVERILAKLGVELIGPL